MQKSILVTAVFLAIGIVLPSALVFSTPSMQEEQETGSVELATPRPMTVDDSLDMDSVGGALMSPDGEWVLFSKNQLDWEENERTTKWYMIPSSGGEAFEYIGEEGGGSFQFSPDGKYLALTRSIDLSLIHI